MIELNKIYNENCLDTISRMPDNFIDCCVTSPPYYGLRDYGHLDQIGLEETPELYVQKLVNIFSEVKRVLRDDGTLWLNLGDSYIGGGRGNNYCKEGTLNYALQEAGMRIGPATGKIDGYKPKDLAGIPWAVATALRNPYYTGKIKDERDRIWLAAMIDAEGCICGSSHVRKDDGMPRTNIMITITNTNESILERAFNIFPQASKHIHESHYEGHLGSRESWRWHVFSIEGKQQLITEIYPYLIAKKKQAIIAWNFLEYQKKAKHYGKTPQMQEIRDLRQDMVDMISQLNKGNDIDLPNWMKEPPSLWEDGWYLRQDIIWHKPNPMPESVTDRCTKSHEYIFLLTKSAKYYYDADAIKNPVVDATILRMSQQIEKQKGSDRVPNKTNGTMKAVGPGRNPRKGVDTNGGNQASDHGIPAMAINRNGINGHSGYFDSCGNLLGEGMANKKSVWVVPTMPFKEAHFATFPEDLIIPCIKAGSREDGIVYDPFMGAGTTALVSHKLDRKFIGSEINPEYCKIAEKRIKPYLMQQKLF